MSYQEVVSRKDRVISANYQLDQILNYRSAVFTVRHDDHSDSRLLESDYQVVERRRSTAGEVPETVAVGLVLNFPTQPPRQMPRHVTHTRHAIVIANRVVIVSFVVLVHFCGFVL